MVRVNEEMTNGSWHDTIKDLGQSYSHSFQHAFQLVSFHLRFLGSLPDLRNVKLVISFI